MSFSLKNIIFTKLHPKPDKFYDPNKNLDPQGQNRGTVQRYQETLGDDYDTEIQSLIDSLVQNNLDPEQAMSRFLPLLEYRMRTVSITDRRKALQYAIWWAMLRGTRRGYRVMLSAIGLILDDLVELDPEGGFDVQNHTLDEDKHTFDTACPPCSEYELHLSTMSGVTFDQDLKALLFNVIRFNEPINAVLAFVMVDGSLVVEDIISVNVTSSGDLEYDDQDAPDTTLYLENDTDVQQHTLNGAPLPDGDLAIDSPDASHYSVDLNGDLIYTT